MHYKKYKSKKQQQKIWSSSNADLKFYCSITLRRSGPMMRMQVHLISAPTNSISIDSAGTAPSCTRQTDGKASFNGNLFAA